MADSIFRFAGRSISAVMSRGATALLLCFWVSGIWAQKIDSMMKVYADNYPQEKLYLQFDKNVYNPGETIWFKAYLFSGTDPSLISKNFYAELSDGDGNILQRRASPIFESSTSGNFDIPVTSLATHLHIRAYTDWMLNFDTAFLYEKDLPIATGNRDSLHLAKDEQRFLHFFPEGGEMVAGLENNVAFKGTDGYGRPFPVKGVLRDPSGKDILEFNSVHDGMGKFLITPDKGDAFYAFWKDDLGRDHKTEFPAIKSSGVVLRLMSGNKKIFFSIARSSENAQAYKRLSVIGHMNQQLLYKAFVNLDESYMSGGSIPTDQLPTGILQVTVFNGNLPLAERVIFINNHDFEFTPDFAIPLQNDKARGRNVLEISVPDTLRSNLSLAATDADADGEGEGDDNIISRILLTGDIRGQVYNPYYYFSSREDSVVQHLDLVMLTHGWRRFKWEQLAAGIVPRIRYPNQNYLAVQAEVLGLDPSRINKDEAINIFLHKKDSSTQMLQIPRVKGGKFGSSGLIFYDTAKVYYQFNLDHKLSSEAAVIFTSGLVRGNKKAQPLTEPFGGWTQADTALLRRNAFLRQEESKAAQVQNDKDKKIQTLAEVTVKGRAKSPTEKLDEQYASGLFAGGDAISFDLIDDPISQAYNDIFTYLQGKVAGLLINVTSNGVSLSWRGQRPLLYMNEMQITDPNQIKETSVSDIAMVKVFRPGTAVGSGGGGGAIAIYTKKGADKVDNTAFKGLDRSPILGYSPIREFYAPDYDRNPELNRSNPDIRATLLWKPFILIDKSTRKITVPFFNNDITRRIRIVLEGINEEGKLTRIEKIIQ
jgi:hypothetical protein